jgi:hypothetical protein
MFIALNLNLRLAQYPGYGPWPHKNAIVGKKQSYMWSVIGSVFFTVYVGFLKLATKSRLSGSGATVGQTAKRPFRPLT